MALYSWGANSHGQLGLGFESELCMTPQRISRLPFTVSAIRSIKGGGGHVLILDNNGHLFSCGWNNRGQLGLGTLEDINEFTRIPSEYFNDETINKFSCGWDISGVITNNKKCYVWGANNFQQLGICQRGFTAITRPLRLNLPHDEIPKNISFGLRHCAILTEDNKIYIFGRLRVSDIHNDLSIQKIPFNNKTEIYKIQTDLKILKIKSGQNHLLLVVETDDKQGTRIIGIGDNKYGQINSFESDGKIKILSTGWTHNGILTNKQQVFLWGRNSYGQIGSNNMEKDCYRIPNKLQLSENSIPTNIHLGSEHGLIITSPNGKIFTWGWNEHGNCGNNTTENLFSPTLIELPSACKIAGTGAGFCYALCEQTE